MLSITLDSRLRGYFDLHKAWVKELRDQGRVKLHKVEGKHNLSDVLTKLMRPSTYNNIIRRIQGTKKSWGTTKQYM